MSLSIDAGSLPLGFLEVLKDQLAPGSCSSHSDILNRSPHGEKFQSRHTSRHGVETAVLISYADYQQLYLSQQKLSEFLQQSPLVGSDLDLTRDSSPVRPDVDL